MEFFDAHGLPHTERQTKATEGTTPAGGRNIQGASQYRPSDLQSTSGRVIGDLTKTELEEKICAWDAWERSRSGLEKEARPGQK